MIFFKKIYWIMLGLIVFSIIGLWGGLAFYLIDNKNPIYKNYDISALGAVGDFFNIATSAASIVTVVLVFIAYIAQVREFRKISEAMDNQKESAEKEERINRAMSLYEDWLEIKNNSSPKKEKTIKEILDKYHPLIYYIVRITRLKTSSFSKHIALDTLKDILEKEGAIHTANTAIIIMKDRKRLLKLEKSQKITEITRKYQMLPPTDQGDKESEMRDVDLDFLGKIQFHSDNIDAFNNALVEFKSAFKCE